MQSPFTVLFAATRLKQLLKNDAARFVAAHDAMQVSVNAVCVKRDVGCRRNYPALDMEPLSIVWMHAI